MHSNATTTKLVVRQPLEQPVVSEIWAPQLDLKKFGPKFKKDAKPLESLIVGMSQLELEECKKAFEEKGQCEFKLDGKKETYVVDKDMMQVEKITKKETSISLPIVDIDKVYEYTPNVIEPSFGIGRILYSLIEHSYWPRPEDKQRGVFPPTHQSEVFRSSPSPLSLRRQNVFSSHSQTMSPFPPSSVSSVPSPLPTPLTYFSTQTSSARNLEQSGRFLSIHRPSLRS